MYKSVFLPKIVGILLVVAGIGYVADVITFSLFPTVDVVVSEFTFVGELLLLLSLLVKGVNVQQWEKRMTEAASILPAPTG